MLKFFLRLFQYPSIWKSQEIRWTIFICHHHVACSGPGRPGFFSWKLFCKGFQLSNGMSKLVVWESKPPAPVKTTNLQRMVFGWLGQNASGEFQSSSRNLSRRPNSMKKMKFEKISCQLHFGPLASEVFVVLACKQFSHMRWITAAISDVAMDSASGTACLHSCHTPHHVTAKPSAH